MTLIAFPKSAVRVSLALNTIVCRACHQKLAYSRRPTAEAAALIVRVPGLVYVELAGFRTADFFEWRAPVFRNSANFAPSITQSFRSSQIDAETALMLRITAALHWTYPFALDIPWFTPFFSITHTIPYNTSPGSPGRSS